MLILNNGMKSFLDEVKATPGGEHVLACIQCGACVGGCPSDAISLNHYTNEQLIAQMEGAIT